MSDRLLDQIQSPEDLRALPADDLLRAADDITPIFGKSQRSRADQSLDRSGDAAFVEARDACLAAAATVSAAAARQG